MYFSQDRNTRQIDVIVIFYRDIAYVYIKSADIKNTYSCFCHYHEQLKFKQINLLRPSWNLLGHRFLNLPILNH